MQCMTFILSKANYGFEGVYWEYVFMHEVENIARWEYDGVNEKVSFLIKRV